MDVQWRMKGGAVQWVKSLLVIFFSLDIQLDGIESRFLISVCFCNKHILEERVKHVYVVSKVGMNFTLVGDNTVVWKTNLCCRGKPSEH